MQGLDEYQDKRLTPEIIREQIQKLEREYPYSIAAEMTAEDLKEFRVHMDGIVTKYRLDTALNGEWSVPFDLAKKIARKRSLALEVSQSGDVAQWLQTKPDKATALAKWITEGIPSDERGSSPPSPKRLIETLTRITTWATKVSDNASAIEECRGTTDVNTILASALTAIQTLQAKLAVTGEAG